MKKYVFLKHLSGAPHIHCKSVKSHLLELENLLSTYMWKLMYNIKKFIENEVVK